MQGQAAGIRPDQGRPQSRACSKSKMGIPEVSCILSFNLQLQSTYCVPTRQRRRDLSPPLRMNQSVTAPPRKEVTPQNRVIQGGVPTKERGCGGATQDSSSHAGSTWWPIG